MPDHKLPKQVWYKKLIRATLDSFVNEPFCNANVSTWEKCGSSHFTHYTTYVAPNYKIYPSPNGVSIQMIICQNPSHCLPSEPFFQTTQLTLTMIGNGALGHKYESIRPQTLCLKQVWESEYQNLIQGSAFDHIQQCFPHIFNQTQTSHKFL